MKSLLLPRIKSIGRDRRPGARRRAVALVALGGLFWVGAYAAVARILLLVVIVHRLGYLFSPDNIGERGLMAMEQRRSV